MRLIQSIVGSGLLAGALALSPPAYPQHYQPQGDDAYRTDRQQERDSMLTRVHIDLDRVQGHTRPLTGDAWKIARAKRSVDAFQASLNSGDYDRRELDRAINTMQEVADADRLPDRWQATLVGDLNRLRELERRLDRGA